MTNKLFTLVATIVMMTGILAGCKTTTQSVLSSGGLHPNFELSANEYLARASQSSSPQKELYTLQAAGYLIKAGSHERAEQLLQSVNENASSQEVKFEKYLITAYLHNSRNEAPKTLRTLSQITNPKELPTARKVFFYDLLAHAYSENNSPLQSVGERIKLNRLLDHGKNREWNNKIIWTTLTHLDVATIDAARIEQQDADFKAWLELAYTFKQHTNNDSELHQAVSQWQQAYPQHAGNSILPTAKLKQLPNAPVPENIALMLPMSGHYANAAHAIRDGFMAAYFKESGNTPRLSVKIYDTSNKSLRQVYQLAHAEGANFIVGPLSKHDVETISQHAIDVPTLALNYLDKQKKPVEKLYQFGISPQDEALQAAIKSFQDGARNAMIVVPNGKWGLDIAKTFAAEWQNLGGSVVAELTYQPKQPLNKAIAETFQITASHQRKRQLEKRIHHRVKFFPRRRQDIDMIFLVANPKLARQIRPLLKFYYAGTIPIYANSSVYSYSKHGNRDIEGITFCDIPWLIDNEQREHASKTFKALTNYRTNPNARLYAMGYDALEIALKLHQLHTFPEVGLEGATGRLYLDPLGKVRRELLWAEFKDGVLRQVKA